MSKTEKILGLIQDYLDETEDLQNGFEASPETVWNLIVSELISLEHSSGIYTKE